MTLISSACTILAITTSENRELRADGVGSQSRPTEVPIPADKEKLWQTGVLSVETPKGLLNEVFFFTMERTSCYVEELNTVS